MTSLPYHYLILFRPDLYQLYGRLVLHGDYALQANGDLAADVQLCVPHPGSPVGHLEDGMQCLLEAAQRRIAARNETEGVLLVIQLIGAAFARKVENSLRLRSDGIVYVGYVVSSK